jgi:hypothetical protein
MESPNIKKPKKLKNPHQYCLTCYRCGHATDVCYKLKKETKKKCASLDKEMLLSEYVNHKVCELQFGHYDLLVTYYLYTVRAALNVRKAEYINQKMCEVQYVNYDQRMSNYLSSLCD